MKSGCKREGRGDQQPVMSGDFLPDDRERMEDQSHVDTQNELRPKPPLDRNVFAKAVNNSIHLRCLFPGFNHKKERQDSLRALAGLGEDTRGIFTISFLVAAWGEMTADYTAKIIDGMRTLRQIASGSYAKADLRRGAPTLKKSSPSSSPLWGYHLR